MGFRDRDRIRTYDRLLRRQMLYPAELRDLNNKKENKKSQILNTFGLEFRIKSGWQDSNLRPPRPKRGAMTGLRYTPMVFISIPLLVLLAERLGLEPRRRLPVDRLAICSVTTPAPLLFYCNR